MAPRTKSQRRTQEEAWWAVASGSGKGWYKVVTVDQMPSTCNCKGYIFRRYCRHLEILAEQLGTTVAPANRKPVTQGRYDAGQKFVATRPSEDCETKVEQIRAAAVAVGWLWYVAPQAWGGIICAGTHGPDQALTMYFDRDGGWVDGGYRNANGQWKIREDQLAAAIAHGPEGSTHGG